MIISFESLVDKIPFAPAEMNLLGGYSAIEMSWVRATSSDPVKVVMSLPGMVA